MRKFPLCFHNFCPLCFGSSGIPVVFLLLMASATLKALSLIWHYPSIFPVEIFDFVEVLFCSRLSLIVSYYCQ